MFDGFTNALHIPDVTFNRKFLYEKESE